MEKLGRTTIMMPSGFLVPEMNRLLAHEEGCAPE
jgi:hypothetical protein